MVYYFKIIKESNFLPDPFKNRSKVKNREENGMDDVTINDASENDRNVVNVIGRDDDSSIHRHSVASTLIRNSEMSIFGSRRSIFRRSSKLTSNASIMTSINVDESFLSPNNGSNSFLLNIVSLTAVQTFSTAKSVPYDIPRMTFLLTIGFPFNICPIDIAPNNISPNARYLISYKVTQKSMRPACIQILYPHGTGAVERLGTNIGKKTTTFPLMTFTLTLAPTTFH